MAYCTEFLPIFKAKWRDLRLVMVHKADEDVISFDLGINFNDQDTTLTEIDADFIPDTVLGELMGSVGPNNDKSRQTEAAQQTSTLKQIKLKKNRFAVYTDEEIDAFGSNSVAKGTHRQTKWGVDVFRGKIQFKYLFSKSKNKHEI